MRSTCFGIQLNVLSVFTKAKQIIVWKKWLIRIRNGVWMVRVVFDWVPLWVRIGTTNCEHSWWYLSQICTDYSSLFQHYLHLFFLSYIMFYCESQELIWCYRKWVSMATVQVRHQKLHPPFGYLLPAFKCHHSIILSPF
jgi:hypothetical protein